MAVMFQLKIQTVVPSFVFEIHFQNSVVKNSEIGDRMDRHTHRLINSIEIHRISGWWFRTFFIFPYIGNNHPN